MKEAPMIAAAICETRRARLGERQCDANCRAEQAAGEQRGIDRQPVQMTGERVHIGQRQEQNREPGDRIGGDGERAGAKHRACGDGRGKQKFEIATRI